MDHLSVSCIDTDMRNIYIVSGEKDEVAGKELGFTDGDADSRLNICRSGERDAVIGKDVLHKARTVESGW